MNRNLEGIQFPLFPPISLNFKFKYSVQIVLTETRMEILSLLATEITEISLKNLQDLLFECI